MGAGSSGPCCGFSIRQQPEEIQRRAYRTSALMRELQTGTAFGKSSAHAFADLASGPEDEWRLCFFAPALILADACMVGENMIGMTHVSTRDAVSFGHGFSEHVAHLVEHDQQCVSGFL